MHTISYLNVSRVCIFVVTGGNTEISVRYLLLIHRIVPKLYGPFSGVTIPSVSQGRRGFQSSNFTVSLLFVTLKTCLKFGSPEQAVGRFTNGLSGPKRFRDFRETGPWWQIVVQKLIMCIMI